MERIIKLTQGYDCIKFECQSKSDRCYPGSMGSHGKCGLKMLFIVKGEAGAVQFCIYTGWLPQKADKDYTGTRYISDNSWNDSRGPRPIDLAVHSKHPIYDGQEIEIESCPYCDSEPCYYYSWSLQAMDPMYTLVNGGGETLWAYLEQYYQAVFEGGEYPEVTEYPMPLRKEAYEHTTHTD